MMLRTAVDIVAVAAARTRLMPNAEQENSVMPFRLSLATLTAIVLVLAVNMALGDYWFGGPEMEWVDLVQAGTRPMGSILAIGVAPLLGTRRPRALRRPFLAGFEVCGLVALMSYLACAAILTVEMHSAVCDRLKQLMSPGFGLYPWSVLILGLAPQLLFALGGGGLFAWYQAKHRQRERDVDGSSGGRLMR